MASRARAVELVFPTISESADLARLVAGFAFALKGHLRAGVGLQDVPGFADRTERPVHVPV